MQPESITLRVPSEVKRAYEAAPAEQKKLAQQLFEALFRKRRPDSMRLLEELAEQASLEAKRRGLTPDKLEEILDEE